MILDFCRDYNAKKWVLQFRDERIGFYRRYKDEKEEKGRESENENAMNNGEKCEHVYNSGIVPPPYFSYFKSCNGISIF